MRLIVITGPSGAGKTLALHSFEDAGHYTVDNLPPRLLPALVEFCREEGHMRAVVVIDIRSGSAFDELPDVVARLRSQQCAIEVLFLDASDEALIHRFKETRRPHPLYTEPMAGLAESGILEAIHAERILLHSARAQADQIIDTSALTAAQLRHLLHTTYTPGSRPGLLVTVISFGFKHGLPVDADLVFDVRFLDNPHYVPELKGLTGCDAAVAAYVHRDPLTQPFAARMIDLIEFALPQYQREGKAYLNIAIGCTGGRHRSVVLSEDLAARLRDDGYRVALRHRDIATHHGFTVDQTRPPDPAFCSGDGPRFAVETDTAKETGLQ
jgi:UPF0042 nucleotide-binding protein